MFAERPADGEADTAIKRTQPLFVRADAQAEPQACRSGGTHNTHKTYKSPWGEVPERSEGGGEAREGESGRATVGSDKRLRPSNSQEEGSFSKADGACADTAQITPRLCEAVPGTAFCSSDRGGAERVRKGEGGQMRSVGR